MSTKQTAREIGEAIDERLRAPRGPSAVRNTALHAELYPDQTLMMLMGRPDAIEAQEAQGQRELVSSEVLPTKWNWPKNALELLAGFGVKLGDPIKGDEIFCEAQLPAGWHKRATDHAMWSELFDNKGRKRAGVFYKAAFYDRSSHGSLERRFNVRPDYEKSHKEKLAVASVYDGDKPVFTSSEITETGDYPEQQEARDRAVAQCTTWLAEHYPDWENFAAYWDQE